MNMTNVPGEKLMCFNMLSSAQKTNFQIIEFSYAVHPFTALAGRLSTFSSKVFFLHLS